MKKSLSLILAIAMVFSMFASVAFAEEAEQVEELDAAAKFEALVEEGIFQGHADGEAGLDENMTRAQAAVVMSELFGLDISNPPASPSFSDVATSHWAYAQIEAAADAGIINGRTNGEFDPGTVEEIEQGVGYVTLQELAIMLTLGFQEIYGLDIDPNGTVDGNVAPWAEHYVAAAIEQGLLPAQASFTSYATRAELVEAAYEAKAAVDELPAPGEPAEQGIASFDAVGAKKLEVVLNHAVDEDDAKFSLKRGNSNVSIKEVTLSDDAKTATIETSAKLTTADYTVTVEVAEDETYSETISVESERVDNIEILSDYAPLDKDEDDIVYAWIKISNQYGEDITKATSVTISSSGRGDATKSNNKITINNDGTDFRIGDKVTLSIVHADTGVYASAVLEVAAPAAVATVDIVELYHEDGDELEQGSDDDQFYLIIEAADQYGNDVDTDDLNEDVIVSVTRTDLIDVNQVDGDAEFTTLDIEDAEKHALQLVYPEDEDSYLAGNATVYILSKTTGQRAAFDLTIGEASEVDEITMMQPEHAVAGEEIKIPFEAYDQFGEPLTDEDDLKNVDSMSSSYGNLKFKQDPVKGEADLILDTSVENPNTYDTSRSVYLTIVTETRKVSRLTLTVQPEAKPDSVEGIDKDEIATVYLEKASDTLELGDILINDQYGRDFDNNDLDLGTSEDDYLIVLEASNSNLTLDGEDKVVITSTSDTVDIFADSKGSTSVTITLYQVEDGTVDITEEDFENDLKEIASASETFRVVGKGDVSEYTVDEINKVKYFGSGDPVDEIYTVVASDYDKEVKVKAFLSNGSEVKLTDDIFSVTSAVYKNSNGKVSGDFNTNGGDDPKLETDKDRSYNLTVVIRADGGNKVVSSRVTVVNEVSEVDSLSLKDDAWDEDIKKESDSMVSAYKSDIGSTKAGIRDIVNAIVEAKDQFDVELSNVFGIDDIFLDIEDDEIAKLEEEDEVEVTAVAANGESITFTILVLEN